MNVQNPCVCHATNTDSQALPERPRFFARQLVTPLDLTLGQEYFRTKLRRHNRLLHGRDFETFELPDCGREGAC